MKKTKISIVISVLVLTSMLLALLSIEAPAVISETPPYLDPNLPPENRALDLLSRMTLDEKVGQMTQIAPVYLLQDSDIVTYNLSSFIGGEDTDAAKAQVVWSGLPNTPLNWAKMYNHWQQIAFENTPLGIPLIWGLDAAHGQSAVLGATIFPHHVGMGSTWNPDLVEESAHITAVEVKATGPHWNFFPNIDVARDDRWGRTYETFSEDPYLVGVMGAHELNGNQGTDLTDNYTIAACGKHYLGSGGTTDGVDQGDCVADDRIIREVHLEPFTFAVKGGAQAVMASFCSVNGEKVHGSTYWLTDVLKEEQGLENKGFILSDWAAIDQVDPNYATAVEKCINAGIDMNMVPQNYATFQQTMKDLINQGKISMSRVDNAVYRILVNKFRLGLFENPYVEENATWVVGCDNHREVARRAVQESTVLLKNDNVLPISKSSSIFVAGPNANSVVNQCGGWTTKWQGPYPETPPPGTTILQAIENTATGTVTFSEDGSGAAGHDVAIVVVGEEPYAEMFGDVTNLDLPSDQLDIIDTVVDSGVPTVVIMVAGRPRTGIESRLPNWKGFLMAWLPGTEGQGVADVLFGDYNPSGKLSRSWPKTTAQEPINYDRRPGENYDPLYEFGYGLSYTTFAYSNLNVTPDNNLSVNDNITVSVYVANTGSRSGSEVVQVYVNDVESTLSTPVKKLYRFKKITLAPNDNNNVSFTISVAELGYYLDNTNERTVENGIFNVMVGGLTKNIEVTTGGTVIPPVQTFTPSSWPTPPSPPTSVGPGSGTGLQAEYYTSTGTNKFDTLKSTVVDSTINWGDFISKLQQETGQSTSCAVRWTGWVEARHSESYTFYANADDGVRLWVDGKLLIDRWVDQAASEYWNSVTLTAGTKYAIKMEYYQAGGAAVAQLSWSSLSTTKEIIPQTQLYPTAPDNTPPVISNVASSNITSSSATITWDTDEIADSLVKYGTTSGNYTDNKYDSADVTSHSIGLTGLTENTTYYYVVSSTDPSNNTSESSEYSFTTEAAPSQAPYGGIPWAIPGKIEAENYDTGGEGVAYHDTSVGNSGGKYRSEDVDIESTSDTGGGYNVGWIDTNEWLEYTVDVTSSDTYNIELRVASPYSGRTFHLEFNSVDVTGPISVPNTGGWQNWTTVTVNGVDLSAGQQVMRIAMDSNLFNINYVNIYQPTGTVMFQNFEPGNGTPGDYFWDVWQSSPSFESSIVQEGTRSVKITTGSGGGTVGINAASSSGYFDMTNATYFYIWVYDTQGSNTVQLRLKDNDGDGGSGNDGNFLWSSMSSVQNQWTKITWNLSQYPNVPNLDWNRIAAIEIYELNQGTYYLDNACFEN